MKLTRVGNGADFGAENRAHLIAGSLHDDALLADESLVFEQFPSPLVLHLTTRSSAGGQVHHKLDLSWLNLGSGFRVHQNHHPASGLHNTHRML